MNTLNPQENLILNTPMSFTEAVAALCEQYDCEESLLLSELPSWKPTDQVIISEVVPADEKQPGVLHIEKEPTETPRTDEERPIGYNFYSAQPTPTEEKPSHEVLKVYRGNLSPEEELELAEFMSGDKERNDTFYHLTKVAGYPVTPQERDKRNWAARNSEAISNYITLHKPILFKEIYEQIRVLYSWLPAYQRELLDDQFKGLEPDDIVECDLIVTGNDKLPNVLHLTKQTAPDEQPFGLSIYARYQGFEDHGMEYLIYSVPGIKGNLTEQEEREFAQLFMEHKRELRYSELYAIKLGMLTHEEASELRQALEAVPAGKNNWLLSQPERIQYLWDKSHYGFENMEAWKEWQRKMEVMRQEAHQEFQEKETKRRAEIKAILPVEVQNIFAPYDLVPTEDALSIIKEHDGWELVTIAVGDHPERTETLNGIKAQSKGKEVRSLYSKAYNPEASRTPIDLIFIR